MANLTEMYVDVAWNKKYAAEKSLTANEYADKARQLYRNDSLIAVQYHHVKGGKWNHMMDQTHIGYTYWQQPPENKMPAVRYVSKDSAVNTTSIQKPVLSSAQALVPKSNTAVLFYEYDHVVSMEAAHWTRAVNSKNITWKVIPDIGRAESGVSTFPVTAASTLTASSPHVEYEFYSYDSGKPEVNLYFSPTLNFHNNEGLQYAVSIDDETPQTFSLNKDDNNTRIWESWMASNIIIKRSMHESGKAGRHVLKYWMISPAVVLQKLVVDFGGMPATYLGAPETKTK